MRFWRALKRLFLPRTADTEVHEPMPRPIAEEPIAREAPAIAEREPAEAPVELADREPEQAPVELAERESEQAPVEVAEPEPASAPVKATEPELSEAPVDVAPVAAAPVEARGKPEATLVLQLQTEGGPAPTFEIPRPGGTLGRGEENTVRLNDLSVSRRHAKITYRQGAFWLSDLGSTSGTWVDGTRLAAPRRVEEGQVIDIGVCRLTVAQVSDGVRAAATAPTDGARGGRRRAT